MPGEKGFFVVVIVTTEVVAGRGGRCRVGIASNVYTFSI